jgi:hypothetical protein
MTTLDEQLAEAHLPDEALVALADGQDILPASASDALVHLASCDACTGRLLEAASLSVDVGDLLRATVPLPVATPEPRALPWTAVLLALALAASGVLPAMSQLPALVSRLVPSLAHAVPVVAHGLSRALAPGGGGGGGGGAGGVGVAYAVTLASALVLMTLGVAVSRAFDHEGAAS